MTLTALRIFLIEGSGATVREIAVHFKYDVDGMSQILGYWMRRGKLACKACDRGCGVCADCPIGVMNMRYYWRA